MIRRSEQRKPLEVLCLQGLRHASRARMREEKMCYCTLGAHIVCVCVLANYLD